MRFPFSASLLLASCSALSAVTAQTASQQFASRQGPNTIHSEYPFAQTAALNITAWLVPVPKAQASKLANGRKLLKPTGLPDGFPLGEDEHPVVFAAGFLSDLRLLEIIRIPYLNGVSLYVPWVQGDTDSQTPLIFPYVQYFGDLIPALIGDLTQSARSKVGKFDPPRNAYKANGASEFSMKVERLGQDQGGPIFSSSFQRSDSAVLSVEFMQSVLQQPVIREGGKNACSKFTYRFNETFSNTFRVKGSLEVASDFAIDPVTAVNAEGISGTAEWVLPFQSLPCDS
ncbi:hypothetical protein CF327_g6690 [Tilletia walkeri]|uniref:Uncharacterized protein n=1 Tax=Tilletia walkeri TaxID=117179 RepID=A0A8X7N4Z6_9BASI|nr:hypothetical protein CF327_g6690 [Tilletia walkeri]KAE8265836.1 hypothetical protein A4X09_0g6508 [Tilletia walkeri]